MEFAPLTTSVTTGRIEHFTVAGGPNLQCLWPGYGGLWHWGEEMLAAFVESPCAYRHPQEAARDLNGIWKRGYLRLRRSTDGGATWSDDGRPFDNSISFEKQRHILRLDEFRGHTMPEREDMDGMASDTVLLMGRAWCGEPIPGTRVRNSVVYCLRSPDRGRRWETTPAVVHPHQARNLIPYANNILRCADGSLVASLATADGSECAGQPVAYRGSALYRSEDDGASWHFFGEIASDSAGRVAYAGPHILALPSGRWLCFMNAWFGTASTPLQWTSLCWSDDQGLNWSAPHRIAMWSWASFPLRLADGRIALFFARCAPDPVGLYCMVSADDGNSWSNPLALRTSELLAPARGMVNLGYPVALERSPGSIVVLYDWQNRDEDVPWYGGRGFVAGTRFDLA